MKRRNCLQLTRASGMQTSGYLEHLDERDAQIQVCGVAEPQHDCEGSADRDDRRLQPLVSSQWWTQEYRHATSTALCDYDPTNAACSTTPHLINIQGHALHGSDKPRFHNAEAHNAAEQHVPAPSGTQKICQQQGGQQPLRTERWKRQPAVATAGLETSFLPHGERDREGKAAVGQHISAAGTLDESVYHRLAEETQSSLPSNPLRQRHRCIGSHTAERTT